MAYKVEDFAGCIVNPFVEKDMVDAYPFLKEILPTEKDPADDIDKIIRYTVMVYDPKSPVRKKEKDLPGRKQVAAELSGFILDETDYMKGIYSGSNVSFLTILSRYLIRFVKHKEFAALCAFEFKFYENITELLTPIVGTTNAERLDAARKKSVISDEIDKDIKRIDEFWEQLYGDKDVAKEAKTKRFTPESFGKLEQDL